MPEDHTRHIAIALDTEEPYPQHQDVYSGVLQYAHERKGWKCVIDQHPAFKSRQRKHLKQYDGVIARARPELQKRLRAKGIPLVNVHYQHHTENTYGVYPDPTATGRLAAEHLIERGFKRFASLNYEHYRHSAVVMEAFKERVAEYGYPCQESFVLAVDQHDANEWIKMEQSINAWLDSLTCPVGALVHAEFNARMTCQLAQARGVHIPQDLSVLCLMNQNTVLEVSPQISSVDMNYKVIGYKAAEMLDQLMSNKIPAQRQVYMPPLKIIARESTNYHSVEDALIADALRYISANLANKINIEDIAYELAVSRRKLQLRFSEVLGRSISEEIRRLRLSTVKIMLAEPDHSIQEIAGKTGFASAGALWHTFKREVGVSPSDYRRELMGEG